MRHYLIGRQYDSERAAYWYSVEHTENAEPMSRTTLRRLISGRIAQENNVSQGTVEKYSRYSRAIDRRTYFSFCLFSTHILKSSVSVCVSFFSAFCSDKRAVPFGFFSYDTRSNGKIRTNISPTPARTVSRAETFGCTKKNI